ncbi:hypothetical protein V6N13_143924 [Hibiscus sabdariffa]
MGVGSTLDTEYLDGVRCCGWFTWVLLRSSHCCKYQLVPSDASRLHPSALKTKILVHCSSELHVRSPKVVQHGIRAW